MGARPTRALASQMIRGRSSEGSGNVLARLVGLMVAGRVGYLIVGFAASIAVARYLGPAGRGLLGLMLSVNTMALIFATFGVPLAVVYFASRKDTDHGALLGNSTLQGLILAAVLVPLAAILTKELASAFGGGRGGDTWILVAALVPITFLDWTTHGQLQGLLLFGRFNLLLVLSRVAYCVGIVIFLGLFGLTVSGAVLATALGSLVMIGGSLPPILRRRRIRLDRALARRTFSYGLRVQVGSIFQLANGRLDVIILQFFRPLSQVGYYVVAQTIAELVVTLATSFQSSVLPLISSYEGDSRTRATSIESVRHHGILALMALLGNAVAGPLIIYFAFGSAFQRAIPPMLILLPGIWFLGTGIVIQGDLSGRGRPGLSSALAGLAAAMTVILDFALIPPFGAIGGALASDGAYATFGIASLVALHRVSGAPIRDMVLPTRADLAAYLAVIRRVLRASRGSAAVQ